MAAATGLDAGLLSAHRTTSFAPRGWPSQTPAYRSNTRAALAAKSGSRMEIHDWYCHGLSASSASQRRTVGGDSRTWQPVVSLRTPGVPLCLSSGRQRARRLGAGGSGK